MVAKSMFLKSNSLMFAFLPCFLYRWYASERPIMCSTFPAFIFSSFDTGIGAVDVESFSMMTVFSAFAVFGLACILVAAFFAGFFSLTGAGLISLFAAVGINRWSCFATCGFGALRFSF